MLDAMGIAHLLGLDDTELARLGVDVPILTDERLALIGYDETDPETFAAGVLRDRPGLVRFADHQLQADPAGCARALTALQPSGHQLAAIWTGSTAPRGCMLSARRPVDEL